MMRRIRKNDGAESRALDSPTLFDLNILMVVRHDFFMTT